MNDIKHIINHIRNRSYMSGIDREKSRIKATGEVFTPTSLVHEILDTFDQSIFADPTETFIDPVGAGDGQFLGEVLIRKMENGIDFTTALESLFGVDLMEDNCKLCRERLLCGSTDPKHLEIVNRQIVCADFQQYHYRFDSSFPYDDELKEQEFEGRLNSLFDFG
jgi:hypothetical protein